MAKPQGPAVAVTPNGIFRYPDLDIALASAHVTLEDPIFVESGPIDQTFLPGRAVNGQLPWDYVCALATDPPDDPPKKQRR